MSKEILFKAKRRDWRKLPKEEWWVEGYYVHKHDDTYYMFVNEVVEYHDGPIFSMQYTMNIYEIDPETLCQYTGFSDKNGKRIWENDIVRFDNCSNYPIVWDEDYKAFGSCWYSDFDHMSKYRDVMMEVIGNVFDNPELLE